MAGANAGAGIKTGSKATTGSRSSLSTVGLVFDPSAKAALDAALAGTGYDKQSAINDAKANADYTIQKALELGLPQISNASKASGGYSSSTQQLLTNDLGARASAAGQQTLLDTIQKYAQIREGDINATTGAVAATTGKTVQTDETSSENTSSTERNASIGASLGGSDAAGAGTVICTQLFIDSYLPLDIYVTDADYVYKYIPQVTQEGYRFLAVPFVRLMRRNPRAYAIGKYFGLKWAYHVAGTPSTFMSLVSPVAVIILTLIGLMIKPVEYKQLWFGDHNGRRN